MQPLFIDLVFNSDTPRVMTTVFLHSLWQGLVFSLLGWGALKLTRTWTSAARYNLLVFLLFAFATTVVISFFNQLSTDTVIVAATAEYASPVASAPVAHGSVFNQLLSWCNANAGWIFLVWALVFLIKANLVIRSLINIDKLRQFGRVPADVAWSSRFEELKTLLGLKRKVGLAESSLISQPLVIGFLKPMVLIPIGLLNNLQPREVEAILLHELAHIRRNDYLVNIIQSFLEAAFFFNPFVYWLSSMIRNEREHCCDALAIKYSGSKKTFLQALVAFHEQMPQPSLAMGFSGNRSLIAQRVIRIMKDKNRNGSAVERLILTACYFFLFIFLASFSLENKNERDNKEAAASASQGETATHRGYTPQKNNTHNAVQRLSISSRSSGSEFGTDTVPKTAVVATPDLFETYTGGKKKTSDTADVATTYVVQPVIESRIAKKANADSVYTTISPVDEFQTFNRPRKTTDSVEKIPPVTQVAHVFSDVSQPSSAKKKTGTSIAVVAEKVQNQ